MQEFLPAVELPPTEPQQGSVIWLHGLGADGHDFEPIAPMLGLPNVRFIFPHAPSLPVTINGGMVMPAWYDIRTLGPGPFREDLEHVEQSAARIVALVDRELARGVPSEKILLAGFSQGAAMALHVGLRYPKPLAGIMVLSGYLLDADNLAVKAHHANVSTPVLFCHGSMDPMVPCAGGQASHDFVKQQWPQRPIEWHTFPMGHQVCDEEIRVIARWLHERFARA